MTSHLPVPKLSRTGLKLIAILCMTLNHMAHILMSGREGTCAYELCIAIGYFTCITMCYLMVEGYQYTSDVRKYMCRLLAFGVIAQYPYWVAFHVPQLNILFSLSLCLLVLIVRKRVLNTTIRNLFLLMIFLVSAFTDWAIMAPFFTLLFVMTKERAESLWKVYSSAGVVLGLTELSTGTPPGYVFLRVIALMLSGVVIRYAYDGEKEKGQNKGKGQSRALRKWLKWFFYIYYPLHLVLLICLRR